MIVFDILSKGPLSGICATLNKDFAQDIKSHGIVQVVSKTFLALSYFICYLQRAQIEV